MPLKFLTSKGKNPKSPDLWVPIKGPSRNGCVGYVVIRQNEDGTWEVLGFAVCGPKCLPVRCEAAELDGKMDEMDKVIDAQPAPDAAAKMEIEMPVMTF